MGGSAFASLPNPLYTPRMSPGTYEEIRNRCHASLRELFICVATPLEGPAKVDHGDVDILVALKKRAHLPCTIADQPERNRVTVLEQIKAALGAEYAILDAGAATAANLAIPWPEELLPQALSQQDKNRKRYFQVDIRACASPEDLQWRLFSHAHGDFWNVLRYSMRPLGLTIDEEALWLVIPEIAVQHRARARVRLTDDPDEVLAFLQLDQTGSHAALWEQPFATAEAMFEYAATAKWFYIEPDNKNADKEKTSNRKVRKKHTRPVFTAWIESFLPRCRAEGRFAPPPGKDLVAEVRAAAFDSFPGVEAAYAGRLRAWRAELARVDIARRIIPGCVPAASDSSGSGEAGISAHYRGCLLGALKKIVLDKSADFGIVRPTGLCVSSIAASGGAGEVMEEGEEVWDIDAVEAFVRANWRTIGDVAWERQCARNREVTRIKEAKRLAAAEEQSKENVGVNSD